MKTTSRPWSDFPYLGPEEQFRFPSVEKYGGKGPICTGGNLSPGLLLSAYEQGLFPWYAPEEKGPILWWSPDPRFVLVPSEVHVGKRLRRYLAHNLYTVTWDRAFGSVMKLCGKLRESTWIDSAMLEGYTELHKLGYVHSCEVWQDGELVGGLYGVRTGRVFSGESMFSLVPNSSKIALVELCRRAPELEIDLIDCQMETPYLRSMGAKPMNRREYLDFLDRGRDSSLQWFTTPVNT